jgi:hypothetical protein
MQMDEKRFLPRLSHLIDAQIGPNGSESFMIIYSSFDFDEIRRFLHQGIKGNVEEEQIGCVLVMLLYTGRKWANLL